MTTKESKKDKIIIYGLAALSLYLVFRKKTLNTTINLTSATAPATPYSKPLNTDIITPVVSKTKDCEITYFNCDGSNRKEIIQIPINDNCNKYQPALPNCARPQEEFELPLMPFNIY